MLRRYQCRRGSLPNDERGLKVSGDFTPEQKRYLEGFTAGLQISRHVRGPAGSGNVAAGAPEPSGPDAEHLRAQDRFVKAGQKLSEQEKFKRDQHPFDAYARLKEQAANNEYPKPADTFRWKFYGLFYVAPAQNSYMCRLRLPRCSTRPRMQRRDR